MPPDARRSLLLYNLFFPFVLMVLLPGFLVRMMRRGNYRAHFGQRLGIYTTQDLKQFSPGSFTWVHSISVGETLVALKLARRLHEEDPAIRVLLSTTTSTGFAEAEKASADWLIPIYNPIDFLPVVRRALDSLRPERILLVEGEAWPNLLAECRRRSISVSLINARLSPRSERRFRRFRSWTGPIFRLLDRITVPEEEDIARWESLGAERNRIQVTGNIKFDYSDGRGTSRAEEFRSLVSPLGVTSSTLILLAGSTFEGEEKILVQIFLELRQTHPELFLILVPRHVERVPSILRDLASFPIRITRRTDLPPASPAPSDVLLVDTTGELADWYHLATIVFIGKSLAEVGGQNPAEAVILGKPVLFGPHMENFAALTGHLLKQNAAMQITDASALQHEIALLLGDEAKRNAMGEHARNSLTSHRGATARTLELLKVRP